MTDILFSVVIPTFNRRHQLSLAVSSVLEQKGVEVEVIVVDDGSTDGTVDWLAREYAGQPVRILPNTRKQGPAGARNTGILAATGDFVALLDSDDVFLPEHLLQYQQAFTAFPEVDVIFGRALYEQDGKPVDYMGPNFVRKLAHAPKTQVDGDLMVFSDDFFSHLLQYGCYFNLSTVALRAPAAKELMNEDLRIAEDYEYWVRLSRTHRFACFNQPQIRYTLHGGNISFEEAHTAAENAPSLMTAYKIMLGYPSLERKQKRLIKENMAEVLFSWAYRCRKQGQLARAANLHLRSIQFGKRYKNVVALAKLCLLSLVSGLQAVS